MGLFPHAVVTQPVYSLGMGLVSSLSLAQVPLNQTMTKKLAILKKAGVKKTDFLKAIFWRVQNCCNNVAPKYERRRKNMQFCVQKSKFSAD